MMAVTASLLSASLLLGAAAKAPPPPPPAKAAPPAAATAPAVPDAAAATAPTPAAELPPAPYAGVLLEALAKAAPAWVEAHLAALKPAKGADTVVVLDVGLSGDGELEIERLAVSSRSNDLDDLARTFLIDAEPFPPPDPRSLSSARRMGCVIRWAVQMRAKPALELAAACRDGDKPVWPVAGFTASMGNARDPGARLFAGWTREAQGDLAGATRLYREAVRAAPDWDLAARALGLALVQAKNVVQAIPYLNVYVEARRGEVDAANYAREIERFKQLQAKRLAEANRVRDRLSNAEIALGIKKGYALLEPCLAKARAARLLAVGTDTLLLTWTIKKDGTTQNARLEGPLSMQLTEHAECVERAVAAWRFPRYSAGSEITATKVPLKVRGAKRATVAAAPATTAETEEETPVDEPTFSRCERSPDEIQGYIRTRQAHIQACILAERRRAPAVALPESLPIAFVADADGPVRSVSVEHRAYRSGPLALCVAEALSGTLLPSNGADCPADFNLDLKRLAPRRQ